MMRYSVQPRDRIFVKGYGFFPFAKNTGKNIGKNKSKNLSGKYDQTSLIMLSSIQKMRLKLLQKEQFKKQQRQLVIWLVIKLLITLREFQKIHNKIIQKQLQMRMKKIYISRRKIKRIIDDLR